MKEQEYNIKYLDTSSTEITKKALKKNWTKPILSPTSIIETSGGETVSVSENAWSQPAVSS